MTKNFIVYGSVFAMVAVILGAFGAHALKSKLSSDQLQIFETGVRYQMYHSFAILILALLNQRSGIAVNYSGLFFILGILLFSGSLYLLACREIMGIDSWKKILGPITPIGGLCFIMGWILLLVSALKSDCKIV
jgi:uncharacterized membrane protein YgdD (TMEM256/DUF423 family)